MNDMQNPWEGGQPSIAMRRVYGGEALKASVETAKGKRESYLLHRGLGFVGIGALAASMVGWMVILPLKQTVNVFWLVDRSTGIISKPISVQDAPATFGAATEEQYLRQYITARAGWIPEMDRENDHLVKLMSRPDEQQRYQAERSDPLSAVNEPGKDGQVKITHFRFHPQEIGKDGLTRHYWVQYDRTIWRKGQPEKTVPWSVTVDFQWLPWMKMLPDDRTMNPGGFQAISWSASPDTTDTHRR